MGRYRRVFTRRQYLLQSSAASFAFTSPGLVEAVPQTNAPNTSTSGIPSEHPLSLLRDSVLNPPFSAPPMTRRFWFGGRPAFTLERLVSWVELADGKNYSGWGTNETDFEIPDLGREMGWNLDPGSVRETAGIALNGVALSAAWKGLRQVSSRDRLKAGSNHLKVEVGNLWTHRVLSLPKRDFKQLAEYGIRWGTDQGNMRPSLPSSGLRGSFDCFL